MHFSNLKKGNIPHYGVYKTDQFGRNTALISKCLATIFEDAEDDILQVYPCQAWQVSHTLQSTCLCKLS